MDHPLTVTGAPGSPYTRKVLAALRYRGVPYRFVSDLDTSNRLLQPRVKLWPVVYFVDGLGGETPMTDSTPILRRLDAERPYRKLTPDDPRLAFLDALIEDYADEWLTKAMFHYRWTYLADIQKSARVLPNWFKSPLNDEQLTEAGQAFADRQIARLGVVGSNISTASTIEQSFVALIDLLEKHLTGASFLWGSRPGVADFGLMGQLSQLAMFDPTPANLVVARAPRVIAWTIAMEDLSGWDGDWCDFDNLPTTINEILAEIGATYAPLLMANAAAFEAQQTELKVRIRDVEWKQSVFPYQLKCLRSLQSQYSALSDRDRAHVDQRLKGTGCDALFADLGSDYV